MVWNRHDVISLKNNFFREKNPNKNPEKKSEIEKKIFLTIDGKSFLDQLFFRTFFDPDFSKFLIKRSGCVLVLN